MEEDAAVLRVALAAVDAAPRTPRPDAVPVGRAALIEDDAVGIGDLKRRALASGVAFASSRCGPASNDSRRGPQHLKLLQRDAALRISPRAARCIHSTASAKGTTGVSSIAWSPSVSGRETSTLQVKGRRPSPSLARGRMMGREPKTTSRKSREV